MSGRVHLTVEELIPKDFLKRPKVVVAEYGNGWGKTHASVEYAVELQKVGLFDRIYILQYSQAGCKNVVNKIVKMGGWAVHHIGLEKYCPFWEEIKRHLSLGIPASFFCYDCQYFRRKSRLAYVYLADELKGRSFGVIEPKIYEVDSSRGIKVCTHPVLRAFVLEPSSDIERRAGINETPIIVLPGQLFLNHKVIGKWREFSKRQKRARKTLLIVDEADSLFYSALKIEVAELEPSGEDYELLRDFSTRTRRLENMLNIYKGVLGVLERVYKNNSRAEPEDVSSLEGLLSKAKPLLDRFNRVKRELLRQVVEGNIRTSVFKVAGTLEELLHAENLELVLKTLEKDGGVYILQDYDYVVKLFFDTDYPWRSFWKIILSATMPTTKIAESKFVSEDSKRVILMAERRTRTYQNVYVSTVEIFEGGSAPLDRNKEIKFGVVRALESIENTVAAYKREFGRTPGGVTMWFGNTKQLSTFINALQQVGVKVHRKRKYAVFYYGRIPVFCSYVGSPIARGLDLDKYDISIVVGPLLRPPRNWGLLDVIDFGRGVAEAVQAAMRIVRSPKPKTPKLVVVERHMATSFYSHFYPSWFRQLFETSLLRVEATQGI